MTETNPIAEATERRRGGVWRWAFSAIALAVLLWTCAGDSLKNRFSWTKGPSAAADRPAPDLAPPQPSLEASYRRQSPALAPSKGEAVQAPGSQEAGAPLAQVQAVYTQEFSGTRTPKAQPEAPRSIGGTPGLGSYGSASLSQTSSDKFSQLKARSAEINTSEKDLSETIAAPSRAVAAAPAPRPERGFKPETVRREERKIQDVWLRYWSNSEVVRRYEKDWFSQPDLTALYQSYVRDHDPVAYMVGLAASQSFRGLAAKYAREPMMLALLRDSIKAASLQAIGEGVSVLAGNSQLGRFVSEIDQTVRSSSSAHFSPVDQALATPKAPKEIKLPRHVQFE